MVEELGKLVEELDIPVDGDTLRVLLGIADRLNAKLAEALGAFDATALWELTVQRRSPHGCATTAA